MRRTAYIAKWRMAAVLAWTLMAATAAVAQPSSPVMVDGKELWRVSTPRAGFSAAERAADTSVSIQALAEDGRRSLADARDVHLDSESILLVSRLYLFSVTDDDARVEGRSRRELFAERKGLALRSVQEFRAKRSWQSVLRACGYAAAGLLLGLASLTLLRAVYRRLTARLLRRLPKLSGGGTIRNLYRAFAPSVTRILRLAATVVYIATALSIVATTLSFVLGQFPATASLADAAQKAAGSVVASMGDALIGYLPNLVVLIIVALVAYGLVRLATALFRALGDGHVSIGNFHREWAEPTKDLVVTLVILFALVVAFPYLPGGDSAALKGASIFVGVLVSLGSGSAMGNIIAGVILTYMRPYRAGDRVRVAGTIGDVVEKSLLVTRIQTIKNVEVVLPNSTILGAQIENFSANAQRTGLILHTTITIGYDAPWRTVHDLLIRAALRTSSILADPAPFVFQTSLNDFHVSYEINCYTDQPNRMAATYSELHQNIQEEFNLGGVEIMSPTFLSVRDGNTVTIPEAHRTKDYIPPSFRIRNTDGTASPPES